MTSMEQVSKEMMEELKSAHINSPQYILNGVLSATQYSQFFPKIREWYFSEKNSGVDDTKNQLKLIKHIWLHEPQFEEEKPKKWIVRSKQTEYDDGESFAYVRLIGDVFFLTTIGERDATKFNSKEEADKWTNPLYEAVEVDE